MGAELPENIWKRTYSTLADTCDLLFMLMTPIKED